MSEEETTTPEGAEEGAVETVDEQKVADGLDPTLVPEATPEGEAEATPEGGEEETTA